MNKLYCVLSFLILILIQSLSLSVSLSVSLFHTQFRCFCHRFVFSACFIYTQQHSSDNDIYLQINVSTFIFRFFFALRINTNCYTHTLCSRNAVVHNTSKLNSMPCVFNGMHLFSWLRKSNITPKSSMSSHFVPVNV